jgi:long-chain-fatty-acid--[acyl-carrier-protein] ligase
MPFIRYLFWKLAALVLSLRYRRRVHGLREIRDLKGPVLILPNHPGYIDPLLVLSTLWPSLRPRPLLFEGTFSKALLRPMDAVLRAVRVPDLQQASAEARERTEQAIQEVIQGLKRGDNFILWPSGRAQRDGMEHLGAARSTADILQAVPEAKVVLVRTRGVWGSMFSYARTGKAPELRHILPRLLGVLAANLLVFAPRRPVDITMESIPRDRLPPLQRETLNPWLEEWYNQGQRETPTFVPYHFAFGARQYEFPPIGSAQDVDLDQVKPQTRREVAEILAHRLKRSVTPDLENPATTLDQLGMDSLDRMEVTLAIEQRFGFSGDEVPSTVGELWAVAQGLVEREAPKPPPPAWFAPPSDEGLLQVMGETIPEGFIARALANPKDTAVADELSGVLNYERLLVGTLLLSRQFSRVSAANVGLLLPASVAADIAFLGLHLAGKLPVILNWTTGPANLAHAAQLTGLTHVVTSRAFIDRTSIQVAGVEFLYIEDLRKQIGTFEKIRTLLLVRWQPGLVRKHAPRADPHQPAVVLFTSGSEAAPKAVPLTHANIIAEMRAAIPFVGLTRGESMLGFLPPFHSFGIAATTLLPIIGGMRVVHHPDPTDAGGLARKIAAYRPTFLVGTPTFVSYLLDRATPEELACLRLIVVGAEKCPQALYERCARDAPGAALLEGYGITECSPVVAVNRPNANRPGTVGQPLPGVEVAVFDPETEEPLPQGAVGMLWVTGPTIFPGYLGYEGPSPFRERDGKRWYVTGDLAQIDTDGYITLAGRLKRFLKAGGEMISLPALEEPFARLYPPTKEGPRVAVEGVEHDGGRQIVLFTTEQITLADANALLLKEGFRGVMRLDEVRHVDAIPTLGTGKVDYKVLRARIAEQKEKATVPAAS